MSSDIKLDKFFSFLSVWKTRNQIIKKFDMSNTESYNLLNRCRKAKWVIRKKIKIEGHQNQCWFYMAVEEK